MSLLDAIRDCCEQFQKDNTFWIAYSGGLDSQVLLSVCHQLRTEIKLNFRAIHINHHISPHANAWALHCKKTCEQFQIEYSQADLQLDLKPGDSLEEVARNKRYAVFAEHMKPGDVLLTAHHQDDQAETVLLQLLRGAGPKGLSAMPCTKKFAQGYHARPLLSFSRKQLQEYANANQLSWVNDESNDDIKLSRNFIRHEILSRLISHWPAASESIARSAMHCAENQELLNQYLQDDYQGIQGTRENTVSVTKLLQLKPEKQKLLLRAFIYQQNIPLPNSKKMQTILHDVLHAAWDKSPVVAWGNVMLRRHRDDIHLVTENIDAEIDGAFTWEIEKPLKLPHGVLTANLQTGKGLRVDIKHVSVSFRQGGEMLEIKERGGNFSLKNLFQEWNVLPWERNSLPLIYAGEKLIAVAGYFLHTDFKARDEEQGREIVFERCSL